MQQRSIDLPRFDRTLVPGLLLLGVWFAGQSLGLMAARFYGEPVAALALSAGAVELTFRNACLANILPLFLSAFAVLFFHRFGAYLACFLRALTIGFLLGAISDAGGLWLGVLLAFSALASGPVVLWYLWRRLTMGLCTLNRDIILCTGILVLIAAVDSQIAAPFLALALSY